jgi:two-component system, cell cycle sensor histidine kinase and response regulator CckA
MRGKDDSSRKQGSEPAPVWSTTGTVELKDKEAWFISILHSAMDAIISVDDNQRIILFNRTAEVMFKYSEQEVIGKPLDMLIPDRFREAHRKYVHEFGDKGITNRRMGSLGTVHGLRATGEEFPLEASISYFKHQDKIYYTVILRDITERLKTEEQIKLFEHTIKSINESITLLDLEGNILFVNSAFHRTFGYSNEEILGKNVQMLLSPKNHESITSRIFPETFHGGWDGELIKKKRDGTEFPVYLSTSPLKDESGNIKALIGVSHDLSRQKFLEEQLIRHHKMQGINVLAKGIAHHFNNILTIIMGYASVSGKEDITKESLDCNLDTIIKTVDRGTNLVKQMFTFMEPEPDSFKPLDINKLIDETTQIALEPLPQKLDLSTSLSADLPPVNAAQTSIQQVLLNLLLNAREAMPDGGTITIETKTIKGESFLNDDQFHRKQGEYVCISITDTGIGMDNETKNQIFDPFFTTHDVGKGIGLGLTTVYGIVQNHNGYIKVDSEVNERTTVHVYLPLTGADG